MKVYFHYYYYYYYYNDDDDDDFGFHYSVVSFSFLSLLISIFFSLPSCANQNGRRRDELSAPPPCTRDAQLFLVFFPLFFCFSLVFFFLVSFFLYFVLSSGFRKARNSSVGR